ncbi:hypothetical protein K431DRAFT_164462 [Polychaeton citri CBS 116435]|uniref:Uncharacterized protein n=1 Tax=Polychaeton citri CBS 116435 TaxID=1314669 RepID=A0A9P4QFN6_9PEZI|nr:hypothetical protein K431DRAFT_164462 [Polychaeton citri CBS 116435]
MKAQPTLLAHQTSFPNISPNPINLTMFRTLFIALLAFLLEAQAAPANSGQSYDDNVRTTPRTRPPDDPRDPSSTDRQVLSTMI